jgi:hypothetical protein
MFEFQFSPKVGYPLYNSQLAESKHLAQDPQNTKWGDGLGSSPFPTAVTQTTSS